MNSFIKILKGQDAFGEPVSINYGGEAKFNTLIGGTLTMA